MIFSHDRGHEIYYDDGIWKYVDNNKEIEETRQCKRCGKDPIFIENVGYVDDCLGFIKKCVSACCGHGVDDEIMIMEEEVK